MLMACGAAEEQAECQVQKSILLARLQSIRNTSQLS